MTQLQLKNGATLVQGQSYAYADGMNLTGITNQVTAGDSATLAYSAANRLTSATGPWGTKTHYYDGVGNRITDNTVLNGVTTSRTQYYSPTSNRLDNIWQNGALLQYYSHDGAGNMTSLIRTGESFAYTYNKRNRLASVTRNSAPWGAYVYNALEQLVSRSSNAPSVPAGTFHYIYDLDGHLIAEADGATGATLREYLWLPANDNTSGSGNETLAEAMGLAANDNQAVDLPLAVIDGVNTATPTTSYIHTDHLGRPTRMTNAAKATVWSASWTPWGEPQAISGTVTQNLRFPGQYFQIETGLAYNWHRHYDPVTGRYTQPDPLRFVDGPSIYAYAGNSPFVYTDRDGKKKFSLNLSGDLTPGAGVGGSVGFEINFPWFDGDCTPFDIKLQGAFSGRIGLSSGLRIDIGTLQDLFGKFEGSHCGCAAGNNIFAGQMQGDLSGYLGPFGASIESKISKGSDGSLEFDNLNEDINAELFSPRIRPKVSAGAGVSVGLGGKGSISVRGIIGSIRSAFGY